MKRELCAVNNGGLDQTASSRDGCFAFDESLPPVFHMAKL